MCGITGYWPLKRDQRVRREIVERMARALVHRGPDAAGCHVDDNVAFGFQRLSIIDLVGGNQPLYNEDRSLILICNGEIFNYRELRAGLEQRGHRFSTASDVEVLLHLYEEEGVRFLRRLNGQFAFALFDRKEDSLFLARDQFGINPLHYAVFDETFIFGSEIKAILQHPAVRREVDLTGLDQVLSFPGLISPRTMFKGISSLKPGHYITVRGGEVRVTEYWDLEYPRIGDISAPMSEVECVDRLRDLFFRSVSYRLQADVPVGYYLSGGLDSSMIAAVIDRVRPGIKRKSFSVAFAEGQLQDRCNQRLVSESVGAEHHEIAFDSAETSNRLSQVIYHCECPIKETYNACTLALSRAARTEGIPVVLTGEGADELFAGYVGYRFDKFGRREAKPYGLEQALEEDLRERAWGSKDVFYERDLSALGEIKSELYSEQLNEAFGEFDCLGFELVNHERLRDRHPLHCRSYLDFKLRLSDHLLADHGDRMALANSVEARHPFLDIDLVEFSTAIPPDLKVNDFTEKYVLRQLAKELLPQAIAQREKFGWFAPGSPELLQEKVEWVGDLLSYERIRRGGYFNPEAVEHLKKRYSQPGFRLNMPYESDLLVIVLTFNLFQDLFEMPSLN